MAKLYAVVALMSILVQVTYGAGRKELAAYIKAQSDPDILPASNGPVVVVMQFNILNVAHADKERNLVEIEGLGMMTWNSGITWNAADYGGIESIVMPSKYFWIPPFQSLSTAYRHEPYNPSTLRAYQNGSIVSFAMIRPQMLCDVSEIATTGANCSSKATMWSYNKDQVLLVPLPPSSPDGVVGNYFAGSKYMVIGGGLSFEEMEYDGHMHQIMTTFQVIKEKPHSHCGHHSDSPMRVSFH